MHVYSKFYLITLLALMSINKLSLSLSSFPPIPACQRTVCFMMITFRVSNQNVLEKVVYSTDFNKVLLLKIKTDIASLTA